MTDKERARRFAREREAQLKAGIRLQRDTAGEIKRQLQAASSTIADVLASAPSDYRRWQLTALQGQVRRALEEATGPATDILLRGISRSWLGGAQLVDAPIAAAGIEISGSLNTLDPRLLHAMRHFGTERIRDITARVANRINGELAQAAIGVQTPFEAATRVSQVLKEGGMRRATGIVRDSLGKAYSSATQQRQEEVAEILPGLQKQWRRSGKLHSRYGHDFIDGQIRDVDQPFELPGGVKLMHPRDPAGPIGEIINCGCTSLPFMAHWKMSRPGAQAFSAEEIKGDAGKRNLARLRGEI